MSTFRACRIAASPTRSLLLTALLSGATVAFLPSSAHAAIVGDPGCAANVLARNDDGWASAALGFGLKLGGNFHTQVNVANNGFVTFGVVPPAWFNLDLATTGYTVIAPFLADVDTRPLASDEVTYGPTTFAGHPAFCVSWGANNGVGFYDMQTQYLNKFQAILVSRPDTGAGDFDIIMNYDQVQWDVELSFSANSLQLPPWGTWGVEIGYVPGNPFAVPGAATLPSLLLDGQSNALVSSAIGSAVPGRYVFPIRNGLPPSVAVVNGTLYSPTGGLLAGAIVQLCGMAGSCFFDLTDAQGQYSIEVASYDLDGNPFALFATAPAGTNWLFPTAPLPVTPLADVVLDGYDVIFEDPAAPPPDVFLSPSSENAAGTLTVFWQDPLQLAVNGCAGGTASYAVYEGQSSTSGNVIVSGQLLESAAIPGLYTAQVPPLAPSHGWSTVVTQIDCPDGNTELDSFNIYIDPSGHVNNVNDHRIEGAVVTLFRAEHPQGPFEIVPDGSAIMSPSNRQNPMLSDDRGYFGWDTIAGYYVVRAEKPGCTAAGDATRPYAETDVLPVPPPVTDLDLRLDCSSVPPPVLDLPAALSVEAQSSAGAVVSYDASALDATDGSVSVTCLPASGSLFPFGTTTVTCTAVNSYGNTASATFAVHVPFEFGGILAPLSGGTGTVKRNQVLPVRFMLSGVSEGLSTLAPELFLAPVVGNVVGAEIPATSVGDHGNVFTPVGPSGVYKLLLDTKDLTAGTYRLRIDLGDGALHTASLTITD